MQEIQGRTRTVREPLSGAKYGTDYYQREYKWQNKQGISKQLWSLGRLQEVADATA